MQTSPRYDIYAFIHKGLRAFMAHTLVRVGRLDAHDPAEVAEVSAEVQGLLDICRAHLRHENDVVHAAMEARAPGSTERIAHEHCDFCSGESWDNDPKNPVSSAAEASGWRLMRASRRFTMSNAGETWLLSRGSSRGTWPWRGLRQAR